MTLSVAIRQRLGRGPQAFDVDVAFEASGQLIALFGRSGSGKTSVVNAVAGLLTPAGRIAVDGTVFLDTALGIDMRRHRRRVGYVFQEDRLFPHLTVRQNLLFGRWFAGGRPRRTLEDVVDLLGVGGLLTRRPAGLSGGERQRVAIGRALLAEPRLLLMDEPLASLDGERKAEILPFLEQIRDEAGIPIVYVSHSIAEIARLATTAVLLERGRVAAVGDVGDVLGAHLDALDPELGAEFGGLLAGRVEAQDETDGLTTLTISAGALAVPRFGAPVGQAVRVRVRARDVLLATSRPVGLSALNVLPAVVLAVDFRGAAADVALDLAGDRLTARITRRSLSDLRIAPGQPIFAILKSVAVESRDIGLSFAPPAPDRPWRA